jgi:hypothetical protein
MPKWEKGTSGNVLGRPKKEWSLSTILERKLPPEQFVQYVIDCAMGRVEGIPFSSQVAAQRLIFDRVEGLAVRRSERTGKLTVEVVYTDEGADQKSKNRVIDLNPDQITDAETTTREAELRHGPTQPTATPSE